MSEYTIAIPDWPDSEDALLSLDSWLSREEEFRGAVRRELTALTASQMGGALEVLVISVGSGGALTVLVSSISTWLKERRSKISVEVTRPDGSTFSISAEGKVADTIVRDARRGSGDSDA